MLLYTPTYKDIHSGSPVYVDSSVALEHAFSARHVVPARSLDRLSNCKCECLECRLGPIPKESMGISSAPPSNNGSIIPVVVVLTPQDVDVKGHARRDRERVKYVGDHLRREIADLFALQLEIRHAVRPRADVDDCPRQRLDGASQ